MNMPLAKNGKSNPVKRGWRWPTLDRWQGLLCAMGMVGVVAVADYVTGYELRLAILYMLPIALATWTGDMRSGGSAAMVAGICWLISFNSNNIYSKHIFYYWEGVVLMATFIIFVILLTRLRNALERADERFLRVLEGLDAGVYVVDEHDGKVLYSNRRFAQMIGVDPVPMHATDVEKRFNIAGPLAEEGLPARRQVAGGTDFILEEARDERSDRWYLIQSGPIPWEHSQNATLKVLTDITEQKQAQTLKHQHREMLHQSARFATLAEIASMLAHEINQPLMAIASYNDACLRMLSSGQYDAAEVIVAMEKCRTQALRAGKVISHTRNFIRRRDPAPVRGNLGEVVREAVQAVELELQDAGAAVDLPAPGPLPESVFDRPLILQVIINLMHNAIDAMRTVEPLRRVVSIRIAAGDDGTVVVSVSDQGAGIAEEDERMLYTQFFTTKPQGIGLGLCICRSVIEAHAGHLWHTANADGGVSFHFALPCEGSNA